MATNEWKLTTELVPESSWFDNMRTAVSRSTWDKLRANVYAQNDHKCGICGDTPRRLNCHEVWEYDDAAHVQRLTGFIALCTLCHYVKHLGLANILSQQGKLDYELVIAHFLKVNECDREAFLRYREHVFEQWEERSKHEWTVDLGNYAHMVQPKPAG
jgi:nitrate/TMAO reductase-like tetraheme cytochrome c subunit